ncbi:cytidylyltransferase domain-containing protein [Sungkyunkwania multivorans]|uniref:Cytidylyltransferase domain-containing protein n=1 Tax=Sungkyunkwania multivorans TaxID=1173618 RepID=A0ABW3D298_9FLAO
MRVLGLIPARGGSKGIPGKNLKVLGGKPLLQFTAETALASRMLSKVVLSSDDSDIMHAAASMGIEVPYKRPAELAQDQTPTLPVVQHAISYYEGQGEYFDAVCLLQVTSPFRTTALLDAAVKKFIAHKLDSLVSVLKVPHEFNPHWTFKADDSGLLTIATGDEQLIPRRQELPDAYHRDGSIYITRTPVIMEQQSLYGSKMGFIESSPENHVNIDTIADWKKAEELLKLNSK